MARAQLFHSVARLTKAIGIWTSACLTISLLIFTITYFRVNTIVDSESVELINTAGKQRMLTERFEKNALNIDLAIRTESWDSIEPTLKLINSELARAGDIFSRARLVSEIEPEPIDTEHTSEVVDLDINGWATDLLELHQGLARQGQVSLVGPLFESSSFVRTQPGKLTQVATNLLKNALEATPQGGQVSLMCQTRAYREGRAGVMLAISDTGPGLSESVMATLQAPKQSTKGGDHQGIGLSVAYRLCAEIGVALDVVTSTEPPQQGTTFTLFIPHQAD